MAEWPEHHDAALAAVVAPLRGTRTETAIFAYLTADRVLLGLRHVAGTSDRIVIPVREVARDALLFDARGVVMAHNHPSGDARPSDDDFRITKRIGRALTAIGVAFDDHLIVTRDATTSLRALRML